MAGYDQPPSLDDIRKAFWGIAKDEAEDTRFRLEALEKLWEMERGEIARKELSDSIEQFRGSFQRREAHVPEVPDED